MACCPARRERGFASSNMSQNETSPKDAANKLSRRRKEVGKRSVRSIRCLMQQFDAMNPAKVLLCGGIDW